MSSRWWDFPIKKSASTEALPVINAGNNTRWRVALYHSSGVVMVASEEVRGIVEQSTAAGCREIVLMRVR